MLELILIIIATLICLPIILRVALYILVEVTGAGNDFVSSFKLIFKKAPKKIVIRNLKAYNAKFGK